MPDPLEVDLAGANAALDAAGGMPETIPSQGREYYRDPGSGKFSKPEEAPEVAAPPATDPSTENVSDAGPAVTPSGTEDEAPAFTHIDDATLTPEVLQMKRSLQADYTRKMQEVAELRRLKDEAGDLDTVRDAMQVYNRLQDPQNWPSIHQELTQYMQQFGMSPAQASQAAANQLANLAPDTPVAEDEWDQYGEESDLAPVMQRMSKLEQQIAQQQQLIQQDAQRRDSERQYQALAEGLSRMEMTIRQQNPHYTDDTIETIYNFVGNDGNLFAAQQKYESIVGNELSRYIANKTAAQAAPSPLPHGNVLPPEQSPVEQIEDPRDRAEAMHRAALAHVAQLEQDEATS